jgi:simple sugar transport system ATP-binding protein
VQPEDPDLLAEMLSGGNQQKLLCAREFTTAARVLVASQPTRGIDIGSTRFLHDLLREYRAAGGSVLLISADLDEILALSDRIAVVYEGRIMDIVPRDAATPEKLGLLMAGVHPEDAKQAAEAVP